MPDRGRRPRDRRSPASRQMISNLVENALNHTPAARPSRSPWPRPRLASRSMSPTTALAFRPRRSSPLSPGPQPLRSRRRAWSALVYRRLGLDSRGTEPAGSGPAFGPFGARDQHLALSPVQRISDRFIRPGKIALLAATSRALEARIDDPSWEFRTSPRRAGKCGRRSPCCRSRRGAISPPGGGSFPNEQDWPAQLSSPSLTSPTPRPLLCRQNVTARATASTSIGWIAPAAPSPTSRTSGVGEPFVPGPQWGRNAALFGAWRPHGGQFVRHRPPYRQHCPSQPPAHWRLLIRCISRSTRPASYLAV